MIGIDSMGGGLLERLEQGPVICAEGYLFELERRGYVQAGPFVPEVVLEHPDVVTQLHRDFVHAGSDVVEAFTYYGHREKMRIVGKEHLLEPLNRQAIQLAKEVATETGTLVAGDTCNTNVYAEDEESKRIVRGMFEEQVGWAADEGVDFVIAETFSHLGEAMLALEVIKEAGLPAVITMTQHRHATTRDGLTQAEACKRLEDAGADVVGLNCSRGPETMLPTIREIRDAVSGHVAALPVPYRTHHDEPTFQAIHDPVRPDEMAFPTNLDGLMCTRNEIGEFATAVLEIGVDYIGLCCGAGPHHIRALAEAIGRTPPASRYSPDMSKHAYFGTDESLKAENREFAKDL